MTDKEKAEEFLFDEETVKKKRVFPKKNVIIISVLCVLQVAMILFAVFYTPKPQDRIDKYTVTVEPLADGSLDIRYDFVWTPLDKSEPLTWVEIGVANDSFALYHDSFSENIDRVERYVDGDYVSALVYFEKPYNAGEQLNFSFEINQKYMLCSNDEGYFFEFIPCWFNSTPVSEYSFKWRDTGAVKASNSDKAEDGYQIWEGTMSPGDYRKMKVDYSNSEFSPSSVSKYQKFDSSGAYNELKENKIGVAVLMSVFAALLLIVEIYLIDSFISYNRGRGFLRGYGYHVHTYGMMNPLYRTEAKKQGSSARGGGRSIGGCACACACACAGGGRAGCSQKDTYRSRNISAQDDAFSPTRRM